MSSAPSSGSSNSAYFQSLATAASQTGYGGGLQMTSTALGGQPTPVNMNTQTMLEYWLHTLGTLTTSDIELAAEVRALCQTLLAEKKASGGLSSTSVGALTTTLEKFGSRSFSCNGILEEAWSRSILKTRNKTYPKVGSKFADNYKAVLDELKQSSSGHSEDVEAIGTDYVNKHHLMLKSMFSDMQVLHENLIHAGQGSAATGNSDLHKALHELTALNGKLDYTTMDKEITAVIQAVIQGFKSSPGSEVFK